MRGAPLPTDASAHAWLWLSLSGIVGFAFGDLCLFRAYVVIGARLSFLLMSLVPPLTALLGWAVLGERLAALDVAGMTLTVGGVAWVVRERRPAANASSGPSGAVVADERPPLVGVLLGIGGAIGQAGGLVLSKLGMGEYDAFAATQVRVIAGVVGFVVIFTVAGLWPRLVAALRDRPALGQIGLGAFFGPFLGVSLSLLAVQHTSAGVAATIMALQPVMILAPVALLGRERVTLRAAGGALLAVGGAGLLFV